MIKRFVIVSLLAIHAVLPGQPDADLFMSPGIIANRGGKWVGSDHLYNLSSEIDLAVEVINPENIPLHEEKIREQVEAIFRKADFKQENEKSSDGPHPFFHLLIMVHPVGDGIVAYVDGRLFEGIQVDRVKIENGTFLQGITWEKQNLILASKKEFETELLKGVQKVANYFVERFQYFEELKKKQ